ncbi:MAG TPA: hypothetical protein ENK14_11770, partial [Caldithrix sp.]|nr:hypothetical protein [Caldithrix sp.]
MKKIGFFSVVVLLLFILPTISYAIHSVSSPNGKLRIDFFEENLAYRIIFDEKTVVSRSPIRYVLQNAA